MDMINAFGTIAGTIVKVESFVFVFLLVLVSLESRN